MIGIDIQAVLKVFFAKMEYYCFCFVNGQMPSFSGGEILFFSTLFIFIILAILDKHGIKYPGCPPSLIVKPSDDKKE